MGHDVGALSQVVGMGSLPHQGHHSLGMCEALIQVTIANTHHTSLAQ